MQELQQLDKGIAVARKEAERLGWEFGREYAGPVLGMRYFPHEGVPTEKVMSSIEEGSTELRR